MKTLPFSYVLDHRSKPQSRGWKCFCPDCGGDDSWYTPDNNLLYCFNCGSSYRIDNETASQDINTAHQQPNGEEVATIRTFYRKVHSFYRSSLTKSAQEYLNSRGIDSTFVSTFQIGYCPYIADVDVYRHPVAFSSGIVDRLTRPVLRGRIVFPYLAQQEVTDLRGRSITQTSRYMSPRFPTKQRGALYAFNYDRAVDRLQNGASFLILTEGEIKAMFADMAGFAAVGLAGMLSYRQLPDVRVPTVIVFDSDAQQQLHVDAAIKQWASRVYDPHVVVLPLLGEQKMDIDAFIRHPKGGVAFFTSLVQSAIPYSRYVRLRMF